MTMRTFITTGISLTESTVSIKITDVLVLKNGACHALYIDNFYDESHGRTKFGY